MVKSKRIVRSFINFLFQEYNVPRIPVRLYWYYPAILVENRGTVNPAFGCYHHDDDDKTSRCIHAIAGTKFGTNITLRIIAHEFVHYLQDIHNRDFNGSEEEEAAYYADALVGKFLQNKRKNGIHIDGVLTVWEPPKEDA